MEGACSQLLANANSIPPEQIQPYLDVVLVLPREGIHGPLLHALLTLGQPLVSEKSQRRSDCAHMAGAAQKSLTFQQPWLRLESIYTYTVDRRGTVELEWANSSRNG